jgi:site-specific DNA-methyltransferase (adenine-specific)
MNKEWDSDKGGRDKWVKWLSEVMREVLRILKPGGHALVWALPRTSHWTGWALEEAGFEIRDRIAFLFGSGFPKSLDVSKAMDKMAGAEREVVGCHLISYPDSDCWSIPNKGGIANDKSMWNIGAVEVGGTRPITAPATPEAKQWDGYGSALKPACEDWWLCRKPLDGTIAENCLKWGTGALWIDECRVGINKWVKKDGEHSGSEGGHLQQIAKRKGGVIRESKLAGRFPANVIHDNSEEVLAEFDKYGERKSGNTKPHVQKLSPERPFQKNTSYATINYFNYPKGSASRFFYGAKASPSERGEGNNHPTVKSLALMEYLCRLTKSPGENDLIIDPFMGSGTTLIAAYNEGRPAIGIEISEEYCEIAVKRIMKATKQGKLTPPL